MDRKHMKCVAWKVLWVLSALSLVGAWVGIFRNMAPLGFDIAVWFWNALVFGILAIPVKLDCSDCGACSVKK